MTRSTYIDSFCRLNSQYIETVIAIYSEVLPAYVFKLFSLAYIM